MTNLEKAARQALEALESYSKSDYIKKQHPKRRANGEKAITAMREALAEQAEQQPVSKALRMAEEALVYHTEQTRPIQKIDEAIVYLRNVMAQGVLNMTFTLEDAMAKYPEISYWHNEFLKHNTTTEQAEQEPVAWGRVFNGDIIDCICPEEHALSEGIYTIPLYAAPVRTKDLTDDEIMNIFRQQAISTSWPDIFRAVIAADREKNK